MPALWMVLGSFLFATMAVGIKFASASFGTMELVLYRSLVSVVFMAIVVRASGTQLRTPVPMMHVWRSTVGVLSLGFSLFCRYSKPRIRSWAPQTTRTPSMSFWLPLRDVSPASTTSASTRRCSVCHSPWSPGRYQAGLHVRPRLSP